MVVNSHIGLRQREDDEDQAYSRENGLHPEHPSPGHSGDTHEAAHGWAEGRSREGGQREIRQGLTARIGIPYSTDDGTAESW